MLGLFDYSEIEKVSLSKAKRLQRTKLFWFGIHAPLNQSHNLQLIFQREGGMGAAYLTKIDQDILSS